jgi:hypothetical protein
MEEPNSGTTFFRGTEQITAVAFGEPCFVVVEAHENGFGVLLAESTTQDSYSTNLTLNNVRYVRITPQGRRGLCFDVVVLHQDASGLWAARDPRTDWVFRNPSIKPYCLMFVPPDEYLPYLAPLNDESALDLFRCVQRRFGNLPGFSCEGSILKVPDDYAQAINRFPSVKYVL